MLRLASRRRTAAMLRLACVRPRARRVLRTGRVPRIGTLLTMALLAAGPLSLAGCGKKGAGKAGAGLSAGVLASVNDAQLTEQELQRLIPPEVRESVTGPEVRDILEHWIRTELLYQKAKQEQLDKDPQVQARLLDLERDLLADEMLQRELSTRARVGGDEVQAFYNAHRGDYTQELHLQQIVLESREDADEVLQQLRGGASFEALAQQRSSDPSRVQGGDLGFLGKGAMNPAFEPYVFDMQVGEIIGPIPSTFGYHIVRLAAKRDALEPVSFDAARDEILHTLLMGEHRRAESELLKQLRGASRVQRVSTYRGQSLAAETTDSTGGTLPVQSVGQRAAGAAQGQGNTEPGRSP